MGERLIEIANMSYTYPGRAEPSLAGVNLCVRSGEFILVSGPTGCGKSTLLRTMNGIIPHDSGGALIGDVKVLGRSTREAEFVWLASQAGLVFQSPEDQLFSSRLEDEVAFGLENLCLAPAEIRERVRWAIEEVGLADCTDVPVAELSGGQKQRLAVASVIAMRSKVLLLDEPLSQLDPAGAEQVLGVLERLRADLGLAIVIVEHRMHSVVHLADRIVLMDAGRVVLDSPTASAFDDLGPYERLGLRLPETVELMQKLERPERPLTVEAAAKALGAGKWGAGEGRKYSGDTLQNAAAEPLVDVQSLGVRYSRRGPDVLAGVDFRVDPGDVVAVMGANGSGKSTLLYALLGELKPSSGEGRVLGEDIAERRRRGTGEIGMLLQNPELMLVADRVDEEVSAGPGNLGLDRQEVDRRTAEAMAALGIAELSAEPPLALSRGQRLRVALASILSMKPRLLLLDEPTTGQDREQIESMMDYLITTLAGRAVIFCTHDVLTAARYANKVLVLAGGKAVASGAPAEVFADAALMARAMLRPPVAAEIARALGLPPVISVGELVRLIAGEGGR